MFIVIALNCIALTSEVCILRTGYFDVLFDFISLLSLNTLQFKQWCIIIFINFNIPLHNCQRQDMVYVTGKLVSFSFLVYLIFAFHTLIPFYES